MKVGIITMHKVINFGSALQSYALQNVVSKLGHDVEIIDYKYPNHAHRENRNLLSVLIKGLIHNIKCAVVGFPNIKQYYRYNKFWGSYYCLSTQKYNTERQLMEAPPKYDVYLTGSDQVWNSSFTKYDASFLLAFANSARKSSYSSSFAYNYIPEKYVSIFAHYLPLYENISVRETSGVKIVKDLTGRDARTTCDPTLLLTKDEWAKFAQGAKKYTNKPYILVYVLAYSFNPFPEIDNIVKDVQRQLDLMVVYLDAGMRDYFKPNSIVVKDAGPKEFVNLFLNASYVITTSFHGTAFSINFEKPFYTVVKKDAPDTRLPSILEMMGLQCRGIELCSKNIKADQVDFKVPSANLKNYRKDSLLYLRNCLQ